MARTSTVTRSAASLLTSRLAVAGIGLAFLGVSARLLSVEEMAVFAVYNTLCGLLTVIGSLGLLTTCMRLLPGLLASGGPEGRGEAAGLLRLAVGVYVAGAGTVTAVLWAAAGPLGELFLKSPRFTGDLRVAALAALCFGLYEASQLLLSALQEFGKVGRYNVAAALAQRTLSLGLFFLFGLKGYLAGFAIGSLWGAGLGFHRIAPFMRRVTAAPPAGAVGPAGPGRRLLYSLPFYADGYLRYFYMHADQILVGVLLPPSSLAVYFIAKRFIQYGQVLVSSLVDPLTTKVTEIRTVEPAALGRAFVDSRRYFVLLFVPLAAMLASMSPFLLAVVGGARYEEGVTPLALLILSLPLFALFSQTASFLYGLGSPTDRLVTNLVSTISQAAGMAAFMPGLGLAGLALARIAGFAIAAWFARVRLRRYLRPTLEVAGPGPPALLCVVPAGAMALMILVPHGLVGRPMLMPLYAVPAGALCLAGYLLWVLTPEDRSALAGLVPGQGRMAASLRALLAGAAAGADAGRHGI
ncbi:MAG TPA: lipopolysaccharide biosynthesis protein [Candidatus Polarisedimenticolia bacterium]|jgi:O-antigen/teichoic acid export membrane protein